jgi:membrane protein implicated in regulation of membrane protease activity
MADWVVWLVIAGGLLFAELLSLTFVLGLLSVAAVAAALAAILGAPLAAQLGAFAAADVLLFFLVRPFERMHRRKPALTTGAAALSGKTVTVVEAVTTHDGRVKLGGETWAARLAHPGEPLAVGTHAVVQSVDGASLVVFPEEI